MKIKEDRLMNAISRFREKIEEGDDPFDPSKSSSRASGRRSGRADQDRHLEVNPDSPFEILLEDRQKEMRRELEDMKGRVNNLVFVLLGAVLLNLLIRLLG